LRPQVEEAGAVLPRKFGEEVGWRNFVFLGPVKDPDAAGAGQPAVAEDAVVPDPDVVVVVSVRVRLAEADAAGEDATVVLENVVGELHVVAVCLQLDAAGAVATPRLEAQAVDAGAVEPGAVLTAGQARNVVRGRGLSGNGDVAATH